MSDELEAIKKRKLAELKERQQEKIHNQQQMQEQIGQLESVVKNYLSKEALQRYGSLKLAHSEKAMNVLAVLTQLIQQGRIKGKLTDQQFKEILKKLEPKKHDINIKRI